LNKSYGNEAPRFFYFYFIDKKKKEVSELYIFIFFCIYMIITSDKEIDDDQDYFSFNNCHHKQITGKVKINISVSDITKQKKPRDFRIIYQL
jgi:hypothetical protein